MSAEALLGQNVALIYKFIEQAVNYRIKGEYWEALNMLDISASLVYLDEEHKSLDELENIIKSMKAAVKEIQPPSQEAMEDQRKEYLNREAAERFSYHLKQLRNYMQKAGYYKMMNKDWKSITQTSTMQIATAPPTPKKYPQQLSSDLA